MYRSPPVLVHLISEEGIVLYHTIFDLSQKTEFFRNLVSDFGLNITYEVNLPFLAPSIEGFLQIFDTETIPENLRGAIEVADYLGYDGTAREPTENLVQLMIDRISQYYNIDWAGQFIDMYLPDEPEDWQKILKLLDRKDEWQALAQKLNQTFK